MGLIGRYKLIPTLQSSRSGVYHQWDYFGIFGVVNNIQALFFFFA
jgi:hypothetical protein